MAAGRAGRLLALVLLVVALGLLAGGVARLVGPHRSGPGGIAGRGTGPRVGVVHVRGVLRRARPVLDALRRFRKDDTIRAIVLRVDSPGGAVAPAQEIHREILRLRKLKPVVASLGTVAASGGYYVASACSKIVASPGTITGSIGVISRVVTVNRLLALVRVDEEVIKSGRFKDTGDYLRPLDEADRALMQGMVDAIYRQFVRDVARGRKLDEAKVREVADGRVITGEEARRRGLVDRLGNVNDALALAAKLAGASGEPVAVDARGTGAGWLDLLDDFVGRVAVAMEGGARLEARRPGLAP